MCPNRSRRRSPVTLTKVCVACHPAIRHITLSSAIRPARMPNADQTGPPGPADKHIDQMLHRVLRADGAADTRHHAQQDNRVADRMAAARSAA